MTQEEFNNLILEKISKEELAKLLVEEHIKYNEKRYLCEEYEERIDEAIQLLNKHSIDCFEKWYDNNDFSEIMNIILEILKGEIENE